MKKSLVFLFIVSLFLLTAISTSEAAANPIAPASSPSTLATPVGAPTASYLQSIKTLQENKYGENEIKSFVYQVFSLFDRHADISQVLLLFANEELDMRLPEGPLASHQDLEKWYAGIGAKYQSNIHTVEKVSVQIPTKGDYRVDLIVHWQALGRDGKFTSFRARQQWKIVDGGGYWPRIVSYIVEPAH